MMHILVPLCVIKIQAMAVIQYLSNQVKEKNKKKESVTEGEVDALQHALATLTGSLQALNTFKKKKSAHQVPQLASLPIDDAKVASINAD